MSIAKQFTFEASHQLPWHQGKCKRLHGHSYKLNVEVANSDGTFLTQQGIVLDFDLLSEWVNEAVIDKLDHTHLNDLLENPTAELIILWVYNRLCPIVESNGLKLKELTLWETAKCSVTLR